LHRQHAANCHGFGISRFRLKNLTQNAFPSIFRKLFHFSKVQLPSSKYVQTKPAVEFRVIRIHPAETVQPRLAPLRKRGTVAASCICGSRSPSATSLENPPGNGAGGSSFRGAAHRPLPGGYRPPGPSRLSGLSGLTGASARRGSARLTRRGHRRRLAVAVPKASLRKTRAIPLNPEGNCATATEFPGRPRRRTVAAASAPGDAADGTPGGGRGRDPDERDRSEAPRGRGRRGPAMGEREGGLFAAPRHPEVQRRPARPRSIPGGPGKRCRRPEAGRKRPDMAPKASGANPGRLEEVQFRP
jgi:hypothetical protein